MLKKKLIASAILALALLVGVTASAATLPLKVGSTGADVMTVQAKVGVSVDGKFGPMTAAAVKAWQASNNLVADGIVGPATWAAMTATGSTGGSTGGALCPNGNLLSNNCLPSSSTPSTVTGGAGDAEMTHYSTSEKSSIDEGEEGVKVLGFRVEAEDSDASVTYVKVLIDKGTEQTVGSSQKITDYLDSVDVYKGATKVASVDAADFSKDTSPNPDMYSKNIAISNAVVKEGDKDPFYIVFNAISSLDEDDEGEELDVEVADFRFVDGTGMSFTEEPTETVSNSVEFGAMTESVDMKSSTSNPDDDAVLVKEDDTSDEYLALAYKFDADKDSADVKITELPVTLTFADNGSTADDFADAVIDSVVFEFMGEEWPAELDVDSTENGSGSATYVADLSDEDLVLSADDVEDVKVYLTFTDQDGNYAEGTKVTASVANEDVVAENNDADDVNIGGADQTGGELTLSTIAAVLSAYDWVDNSTGTILDFVFTVKAEDGDFTLLAADIIDSVDGTATVASASGDTTDSGYGELTVKAGTSTAKYADISGGYTVYEGQTVSFRVRYTMSGTNGTYTEATITSVGGVNVPDDKETSDTVTVNIN